jgi:ATP/maltotriose-dependent transcriptional regulator MalT
MVAANIARYLGADDRGFLDQVLAIGRALDDRGVVFSALALLAESHTGAGQLEEALACIAESAELARKAENRVSAALVPLYRALVARVRGDHERGIAWAREAATLLRELERIDLALSPLNLVGLLSAEVGFYDDARAAHNECLALAEKIGVERGRWVFLAGLAKAEAESGAFAEARGHAAESLAAFERSAELRGVAVNEWSLAICDLAADETDGARRRLERAVEIFRRQRQGELVGPVHDLADMHRARGELEAARALLREALGVTSAVFFVDRLIALEVAARLSLAEGDPARAARLVGAASGLRKSTHIPAPLRYARPLAETVTRLRAALGAALYRRSHSEGRKLKEPAARALALSPPESRKRPKARGFRR